MYLCVVFFREDKQTTKQQNKQQNKQIQTSRDKYSYSASLKSFSSLDPFAASFISVKKLWQIQEDLKLFLVTTQTVPPLECTRVELSFEWPHI